jgi:hypothetical protein
MPVVEALRSMGHDVVTLFDLEKAGQSLPDDLVLLLATQKDRTLVTMNRKHFLRLHRNQPEHAGIIVCSFDPDFDALARRIHEKLVSTRPLKSNLIRIDRPSS